MTEQEQQDLARYRMARAKETIAEIDILTENEMWITAVNRLYYACFYAVSALLISKGIQVKTHAGTKHKFSEYYIATGILEKTVGKFYSNLFDYRQTGDYDDFAEIDKDEILALIEPARNFIKDIDGILNSM